MLQIDGKYTSAVVHHDQIDETSMAQIVAMVNSPAITNPVKIMPDFHAGSGAVIGFTMRAGEVVIPSIVGVDIGCGMLTGGIANPGLSLEVINDRIRAAVPLGFNIHPSAVYPKSDDQSMFDELCSLVGMDKARMNNSVGTLGGGNHFIELGESEDGELFITIHSGSRNLGKVTAEYYQKKAVDFSGGRPDVVKGMEYLPTDQYIAGMDIAQRYASLNRHTMLNRIAEALGVDVISTMESVHNYISPKDRIIRKGATSAYVGDKIILPFNRRDGIWILEGKSNPDWNFSAPHGAGRQMSRSQAKKQMTQDYVDLEMAESKVFSTYNPIDEAPDAYKPAADIQKFVVDTADFKFSIKPLLNIKG